MSQEIERHSLRPNDNFEKLFDFSGILYHYWECCNDELFKEQLQRILDEIESIYEYVENNDTVPVGHRSLDLIIKEGWKLINGAVNAGKITYKTPEDLLSSPVKPIQL